MRSIFCDDRCWCFSAKSHVDDCIILFVTAVRLIAPNHPHCFICSRRIVSIPRQQVMCLKLNSTRWSLVSSCAALVCQLNRHLNIWFYWLFFLFYIYFFGCNGKYLTIFMCSICYLYFPPSWNTNVSWRYSLLLNYYLQVRLVLSHSLITSTDR